MVKILPTAVWGGEVPVADGGQGGDAEVEQVQKASTLHVAVEERPAQECREHEENERPELGVSPVCSHDGAKEADEHQEELITPGLLLPRTSSARPPRRRVRRHHP